MGPPAAAEAAAAASAAATATAVAGGKHKPPGLKRLLVIFSAAVYVLFLGLPVWWATTSLHRPALPHEAMQQAALAASSNNAFLPVSLEVVVVLPPGVLKGSGTAAAAAAALHDSLQRAIAASKPQTALQLQVMLSVLGEGCWAQPAVQHSTVAAAAASDSECTAAWPALLQQLSSSGSASDNEHQQQQQQIDRELLLHGMQSKQEHGHPAHHTADDQAGRYRLYLLPVPQHSSSSSSSSRSSSKSSSLVIGRHRHAWMTFEPSSVIAAAAAAATDGVVPQALHSIAAAAAVRVISCCFALHAGPSSLAAAAALPISAAGQTHLSLSLLNADPAAGPRLTWDMEEWEARYLTPVVASLAPVTRVTTESQVLQYTSARLLGDWSAKHSAYVVKGSQLPFFIDSEWPLEAGRAVTPLDEQQLAAELSTTAALDGSAAAAAAAAGGDASAFTGATPRTAALIEPHVLQLVVYVPPRDHRPLQLLGRGGKARDSNSYIIPSWGGLFVLNPDDAAAAASSTSSRDGNVRSGMSSSGVTQLSGPAAAVELTGEQYDHLGAVFITQLQALFGVAAAEPGGSSHNGSSGGDAGAESLRVQRLPAGRAGFCRWQVDALLRQRSAHDVREGSRVLGALSTLVQELPNLEMPDVIGEQVAEALAAIDAAWAHTARANYTAAAAAAAAAHAAAEAAFSHPAVLAQFNFPDSHKLGVYMPLFLPLSVPLLQGLLSQVVHLMQRGAGLP